MTLQVRPWTPSRRLAAGLLTSAAVALATAAPTAGPVLAVSGQAPSASARLEMREFSFQPHETEVPAGQPVDLTLVNAGVIPHDLMIMGPSMPPATVLNPGQTRTIQVQFASPGVYTVICTISGHADAGMKGTVRVVAPTIAVSPESAAASVSLDADAAISANTDAVPASDPTSTGRSSGQADAGGAASASVPSAPDDGSGS